MAGLQCQAKSTGNNMLRTEQTSNSFTCRTISVSKYVGWEGGKNMCSGEEVRSPSPPPVSGRVHLMRLFTVRSRCSARSRTRQNRVHRGGRGAVTAARGRGRVGLVVAARANKQARYISWTVLCSHRHHSTHRTHRESAMHRSHCIAFLPNSVGVCVRP